MAGTQCRDFIPHEAGEQSEMSLVNNGYLDSYDPHEDVDVDGLQIGSLDIANATQEIGSDPEMEPIRTVKGELTNGSGDQSVPVNIVMDSGASISCVTSDVASELGAVEVWENGPVVQLADGRRARLKRKTAQLFLEVPMTYRGEEEHYFRWMRFAVVPGTSRRVLLGQRAMRMLNANMRKRVLRRYGNESDSYRKGTD